MLGLNGHFICQDCEDLIFNIFIYDDPTSPKTSVEIKDTSRPGESLVFQLCN